MSKARQEITHASIEKKPKISAKTPKTERGKARAESILAKARELFIQGGYAEMTMRQVAERSGISLSNVQHYFPTRESLLQALLEDVMKSYDPAFAGIAAREKTGRDKFVAIIRYLVADIRNSETEKLFVELWSLATRDPMARDIFDRMYAYHRSTVAKLLAAANPALPDRTVHLRAAIIAMQIEGLMLLLSEAKPRHAELEGIEDECVAMILRMVELPV